MRGRKGRQEGKRSVKLITLHRLMIQLILINLFAFSTSKQVTHSQRSHPTMSYFILTIT